MQISGNPPTCRQKNIQHCTKKFRKIIIANNIGKRRIQSSIELDVIIGESYNDLKNKEQILSMQRGPNILHQVMKRGLVGKSDNIAEKVQKYLDASIDRFFLAFQDPYDTKSLQLFHDIIESV
ncbi:MAG: hypothetical protein E6L03_07175 [Thaumarchaeota archaeon]|nr:MAG: hypothetical protein E6L03_07175 [Nitrososphaerota archaeon]